LTTISFEIIIVSVQVNLDEQRRYDPEPATEDRLDSLIALVSQISIDVGGMQSRFDSLEQKVDRIQSRLDSLEQKVDGMQSRFDDMQSRFDSLEQKVDARLHETRPIWESVQQQITGLRSDMESSFRRFDRKFDQLIRDTFEDRATLSELSNRVDKLEEKAS
jgi:uncharacterized protein YukE